MGPVEKVACSALDAKGLAEAMAITAHWPYPGEQDGWVLSHNSIRFDMVQLLAGIETTLKQVQAGKPMAPWQPANLATFFPMFHKYVQDHHDHEEELAFPYLNSRLILPAKMSADHATLISALDRCGTLAKAMKASGDVQEDARQLQTFAAEFRMLQTMMLQHFEEEEQVGLPHMRKHFTYKEFQPVEKKIVASLTAMDTAHFLSPLTKAEKKKWMTEVAHIPGFAQKLIILPACKKYEKKWGRLLAELKAGAQTVPATRKSWFGFLSPRTATATASA